MRWCPRPLSSRCSLVVPLLALAGCLLGVDEAHVREGDEARDGAATQMPMDAGALAPLDGGPAARDEAAVVTLALRIEDDRDDAMWTGSPFDPPARELLHVDGGGLRVGDTDVEVIGLRFKPAIPRGAQVVSATLALRRVADGTRSLGFPSSGAPPMLEIDALRATAVAPFSSEHQHTFLDHAPGAPVVALARQFPVAPVGADSVASSLEHIVQVVVNQPSWVAGESTLVLLVSPSTSTWLASSGTVFADSSYGSAQPSARLTLQYRPVPDAGSP